MSKPSAPQAEAPAYEDDVVRIARNKRMAADAVEGDLNDLDIRSANVDNTSLLKRMASGSNAQATGQAVSGSSSGAGRAQAIVLGSLSEGRGASNATKNASMDQLSRKSNLLNARMGSTQASSNNLMNVARAQNSASLNQLNSDLKREGQRYSALGSIAGTAASYGTAKKQNDLLDAQLEDLNNQGG